jgi:hypothetical protein
MHAARQPHWAVPSGEQPTPTSRAQDEAREVADRPERDERHLRVRERPTRIRQAAAEQDTRRWRFLRSTTRHADQSAASGQW